MVVSQIVLIVFSNFLKSFWIAKVRLGLVIICSITSCIQSIIEFITRIDQSFNHKNLIPPFFTKYI